MPNMNAKAADLEDPGELIKRIAYRNKRIATKLPEKDDPVAFIRLMSGHNGTDLRRLALLMDVELD